MLKKIIFAIAKNTNNKLVTNLNICKKQFYIFLDKIKNVVYNKNRRKPIQRLTPVN